MNPESTIRTENGTETEKTERRTELDGRSLFATVEAGTVVRGGVLFHGVDGLRYRTRTCNQRIAIGRVDGVQEEPETGMSRVVTRTGFVPGYEPEREMGGSERSRVP